MVYSQGITLRDWFASQANEQDILDMQATQEHGMISRQTARYMHADAMIAQRETPNV